MDLIELASARVASTASARLCLQCGYDLQDQTATDRCPECGLAAHESQRSYLRHADARWLATMARATSATLWFILILVAATPVSIVLWVQQMPLYMTAAIGITAVAMLRAVSLLAVPDPTPCQLRPTPSQRWLMVASACITAMVPVATFMLALYAKLHWYIVASCLLLFSVPTVSLMMHHLRLMVLRMPNPHVAGQLAVAGRLLVTSVGVTAMLTVVLFSVLKFNPRASRAYDLPLDIGFGIAVCVMAIVGAWLMVLLVRLNNALTDLSRDSEPPPAVTAPGPVAGT